MSTRIHLFIICIVDLKTLFCFPRIKTTSHLMFFGLLREEDQTFQRMVKNGMKSGRQEGSVLIFFLHLQSKKL